MGTTPRYDAVSEATSDTASTDSSLVTPYKWSGRLLVLSRHHCRRSIDNDFPDVLLRDGSGFDRYLDVESISEFPNALVSRLGA